MFLFKERLRKIKYDVDGAISNVDLGLFQPNKLMFSFVIFWSC